MNAFWCGEAVLQQSTGITISHNVFRTNTTTGCGGYPTYGMYVASVTGTDTIVYNWAYGLTGQNASQNKNTPTLSYSASNTLGTDPTYTRAPGSVPGAPSCGGKASVIDCMSTIIADLVPTASGTSGYGYQPVSGTPIVDPYFPLGSARQDYQPES